MEGRRHRIGEAHRMVAARLPIVDRLHMAEALRRIAAHRLLTVAAHLPIVELPPRMVEGAAVIAVEALLRITVVAEAERRPITVGAEAEVAPTEVAEALRVAVDMPPPAAATAVAIAKQVGNEERRPAPGGVSSCKTFCR